MHSADTTQASSPWHALWEQWKAARHRKGYARLDKRSNRRFRREIGRVSPENLEGARAFLRQFAPQAPGRDLLRLGGDEDGGYLVPDDLEGLVASFSPGVAESVGFDLDIAARGIPCFLLDGSVDGLPHPHPMMHFRKLFLGETSEGDRISLNDWVAQDAPGTGDLLLQMDIEGSEYPVLRGASDAVLSRFRMIVMEFHGFQRVFDPDWRARTQPALDRLVRHFVPVHLHPNNHAPLLRQQGMVFPRVFEVTYYRRDRLQGAGGDIVLPHPLDRPNLPWLPDAPMPRFWEV